MTATAKETAAPTRRRRRASRRSKDPRTGVHVDGSADWTRVKNPRKDTRYIWAYEGSSETGAEYYYDLGYDPVIKQGNDDDVNPGGRRMVRDGEPYKHHGHVLMSIPEADWQDIQDHGADGITGQKHTDEVEDRIKGTRPPDINDARLRAGGMRSTAYDGED